MIISRKTQKLIMMRLEVENDDCKLIKYMSFYTWIEDVRFLSKLRIKF